jgi:photosystem II stability/assembly factor-like uncharacterized protein
MKKIFPIILILVLVACKGTTPQPVAPTAVPPTVTPAIAMPLIDAPQLTQFHFVNENDGWGTTESAIVSTNDGGVTWYNVTPLNVSEVGYASNDFISAQLAYVLLPNADYTAGTLYRTSDGGATWVPIAVPFAAAQLQFLETNSGFALAALGAGAGSEAVAVYKTGDGGMNWTRAFINDPTVDGSSDSLPLGGQKSGFAFLNASRGWVVGSVPVDNYIYLYATQDGGTSWTEVNPPLPDGYPQAQTSADSPQFFSATDGILLVHFVSPSNPGSMSLAYRTTDGGHTWTPGQVIPMGRPASFYSFQEGIAWGGGQFYATRDAGQTWGAITPNQDFSDVIASFQFVNALTGWTLTNASGSDPTLYKTTDGGATWTVLIP